MSSPSPHAQVVLPAAQRARGRWLAWTSHPAGMTHRWAYTGDLATLALLSLGAGEGLVGLQRSFEWLCQILQLPTLRLVGRLRKRTILVAGQVIAVLGGLPLVLFGAVAASEAAVPLVLGSLLVASVGIVIGQTVWFPLLRGYVEPNLIGRFFGILRTVWHVTLILYFLAAQRWLVLHPGDFAVLFAAATVCGVLRVVLVARLPEAPGERGTRLRMFEALRLLRSERLLRRYVLGVSLAGGALRAALPFVLVWMKRQMGLSEGEILFTTVALFAGGFVSLYLWGRLVDRVGPSPVLRGTSLGLAVLCLLLLGMPSEPALTAMIAFFFAAAVLAAGHGVADTQLLFSLTPTREPSRHMVVSAVSCSLAFGLAPLVAGVLLDAALGAGVEAPVAYRMLFAACAGLALLALPVLRVFVSAGRERGDGLHSSA